MFRKIICLIMVVFTLLSAFTISSFAATDQSDVLKDLSTLVVDGVPFSEASYLANRDDSNLYVIATVEQNFRSRSQNGSPDFAFYVYVYNPSCMGINDVSVNSVQMGYNEEHREKKFSYFGLKLLNKTTDGRFLKFKLVSKASGTPVQYLYMSQESNETRVYDIASFRLFVNNNLRTFPVNKAFVFSGYDYNNSLTCYSEELGALDVEMYPTNWISPNAGYKEDKTAATIYDHYEINSVYFTFPRSYVDGTTYDAIKYIGAAFDAYHTTPIIVAAPSAFDGGKGEATKDSILNSYNVKADDVDVFDLVGVNDSWIFGGVIEPKWYYSENANVVSYYEDIDVPYKILSYYFENANLEGYDFKHARNAALGFSSEEFADYFNARVNDSKYKYSLYNAYEYVEKDYWLEDFDTTAFYQMSTYFSNEDNNTWYRKLTTRSDSYVYEDFETHASHVQLIKDPSEYMTITDPEGVANKLFISQYDVAHFSKVCAEAEANDEVVVLLRFGFGDYSCNPIVDVTELLPGKYSHYIDAMAIEKWVYFDVNLLHVAFSKNKQTIVVPVVSNTVDAPGNGIVFPDSNAGLGDLLGGNTGGPRDDDDDDDDWLKKILMIVGIVFLVALLFVLIRFFFKLSGSKQKIHVAYGPPPEEKKRKKKRFRR